MRVRGDGIEDDLAGTLDQLEAGFHLPFEGLTKPGCCSAVRSLRLDVATSEIKVPSDQGPFRPIDVITPKA